MLRDRLDWRTLCALALAPGLIGGPQAQASPAPEPATAEPSVDLYPQASAFREMLDLSGLWDFKLDPRAEGEPKMAAHFLRQRWAGK